MLLIYSRRSYFPEKKGGEAGADCQASERLFLYYYQRGDLWLYAPYGEIHLCRRRQFRDPGISAESAGTADAPGAGTEAE